MSGPIWAPRLQPALAKLCPRVTAAAVCSARDVTTARREIRSDVLAIRMRSSSEPSTQEVLAGLVERVTFHNVENGFCVLRAKARGHRDLVTVIGHAAIISAGEWITAAANGSTIAPTASSSRRD